jgi:hypothetical protein
MLDANDCQVHADRIWKMGLWCLRCVSAEWSGCFRERADKSSLYSGQADLLIDGQIVVRNSENQVPGDIFFGSGTIEELGHMDLEKGKAYELSMNWSNFEPVNPNGMAAARSSTAQI